MGRKKKVENGKVASVRLPEEFLEKRPPQFDNNGDWLRDILLNNAEVPAFAGKNGLNPEEKESVEYFYNLFMKLFQDGKLDDVVNEEPTLLEKAAMFEKVAKNHV